MTNVKKAAVLGAWIATLIAGFVGARLIAPPESTSAPDDFGAAIRAALAEGNGLDRAARTAAVLQRLDPENVVEAAAVYDRLLNLLDEQDIRPFALAWARFDPAAALDHTLRWKHPDKKKAGASAAIEGWATRDPIEALRAYDETIASDPSLSEDLMPRLVTGWLNSGEGGLVEYIEDLSDYKQEIAIARVIGKAMRDGDTDAAMAWVESIVRNDAYEPMFKKRVFRRGIRILGLPEPELVAAWAMEHEGQAYAVDAPRIVAGRLGWHDGPAAMQWVRDLPQEEFPKLAIRGAFLSWYRSDREAAVTWLESETLTAFHAPAIAYYANDLSKREPEAAIAWCERILNSDDQLSCLEPAAAKWFQRDPVAAEAWLQQSSLDEEARRAARTSAEKKQRPPRRKRGPPNPDVGAGVIPGAEIEVIQVPSTPQ